MDGIKFHFIECQLLLKTKASLWKNYKLGNADESGFQQSVGRTSQTKYLKMTEYVENTSFLGSQQPAGIDTALTGSQL